MSSKRLPVMLFKHVPAELRMSLPGVRTFVAPSGDRCLARARGDTSAAGVHHVPKAGGYQCPRRFSKLGRHPVEGLCTLHYRLAGDTMRAHARRLRKLPVEERT